MGTLRRSMLAATALATSAVLATSGAASAAVPTVESTTERVLQSVKVSMGPDGTTTGVGSSVVRTEGSVDDAEADDATYAPREVLGDLPVRVLTSWRTSEGAGTDLSDLQGYTGRVAIDVTVQNLTVKPEMLTYDAAGASRQQAALVGSPLSISASTSLGDLKPERIVTDDRGSGANVTNGVVGKDADGTTVQWAALLAPPILSSSTELSLVVDAKDFDVPTIDLGVQPGLVTDPSIGAMVDAAFNPANSSELELQQRTIELVGEVNLVLARASRTISDVRTSLTSTAETLGTQTVADLQASTQSVTSNMSSLDAALESLRGDLSSTLESTGSSAIAELDQAVTVVDQLLGDTSARVPTTKVSGTGCDTSVAAPKKGSSVYGNLLQVASQLDAYAEATDACKGALQDSIVATIGPENPNDELCKRAGDGGPASVTCSLHDTQMTFETAAEELRTALLGGVDAEGELVIGVLDLIRPELYRDAQTAANAMTTLVSKDAGIEDVTLAIRTRRSEIVNALKTSHENLIDVDAQLATVQTALDSLRPKAESVRAELASIQAQTSTAAGEVCELVRTGTLTFEEARKTLTLLVPQADPRCDYEQRLDLDAEGNAIDPQPVHSRLGSQIVVLDQGLSESSRAQSELAAARTTIGDTIDVLAEARLLDGQGQPNGPDDPEDVDVTDENLRDLFERLVGPNGDAGLLGELGTESGKLAAGIQQISELAEDVANIESNINTAIDTAKGNVGTGVDGGVDDVLQAGANANDELGTMFQRSSDGLKSAGDQVVRNGKDSVNEQKSAFEKARDASANQVTGVVEDGLAQINNGVSSSTRDMEAATALLTADLRKVLLDLGDRSVGGGGLLGAMATNAATARTADYQLALAGDKATSYANVRGRDIEGLQLRQAQTDAAMQMLLDLPAFQLDLPSGSQHRTVYSFTIEDN